MFKDILIHVDADRAMLSRARVAIELTRRYDAHLSGICFAAGSAIHATIPGIVPPELVASQHRVAVVRADTAAADFRAAVARADAAAADFRATAADADATAADFRTTMKKAGLIGDCRVIECMVGDVTALLSLHARHADLVILGQRNPEAIPACDPGLPANVVLACGRPAIIVPFIGTSTTLVERVLIAWDGGREAARAANDALPILETAKSVTVLSVNPAVSGDGDRRGPGLDISLHLARHGIKIEGSRRIATDISVGDAILNEVAEKDIDLLVMGAYGHSRLRELVLGGVTRKILSSMTIPVLMSH